MNQVQFKLTHIDRENQKALFLIKWVHSLYTFIHLPYFVVFYLICGPTNMTMENFKIQRPCFYNWKCHLSFYLKEQRDAYKA